MKRKRGRPKGSTKKTRTDLTDLTEGKADSTHSPEENVQREEEGNKEAGDRQCSAIQGSIVSIYMYPIILSFSCRRQDKYPLHERRCSLRVYTQFYSNKYISISVLGNWLLPCW